MNGRLAALAIALGLLAVWLARTASVTPTPVDAPAHRAERLRPPAPAVSAPSPRLLRDPFRYVDEPPAHLEPAAPSPRRPSESAPSPAAPAPEPIRLSGFVWRGSQLKAVLSVSGTTVVAAVGESAEGYRVISIDEDAGVRVRAPSGEELQLRPPGAR